MVSTHCFAHSSLQCLVSLHPWWGFPIALLLKSFTCWSRGLPSLLNFTRSMTWSCTTAYPNSPAVYPNSLITPPSALPEEHQAYRHGASLKLWVSFEQSILFRPHTNNLLEQKIFCLKQIRCFQGMLPTCCWNSSSVSQRQLQDTEHIQYKPVWESTQLRI